MSNSIEIAKRFREVFHNGKWVANTNYLQELSDVSWKEAIHQIGTLNTIAKLTFHVNYYLEGVLSVFEGGPLDIKDKYSFELPQINSKAEWETLRNNLIKNAESFAEHIERMSDEQLNNDFVDEKYGSYRRNLEGFIEHGYYHLGQIKIIKKMVRDELSSIT